MAIGPISVSNIGIPIFVNVSDMRAFAKRMKLSSRVFPAFVGSQIAFLAREYVRKLKDEAPESGRTQGPGYLDWQSFLGGPLRESFRAVKHAPFQWTIYEASYGKYVRMGIRGGYSIRPRMKKALWWPGLGRPILGVSDHPGIKTPNPYDIRADKAMVRTTELVARRIGFKVVNDLTGRPL